MVIGSFDKTSMYYTTGRLTHTTTTSGSTILTATVNDYDPMGRIFEHYQCAPPVCGRSAMPETIYYFDLAGDINKWIHPTSNYTITQTINNAREVQQVTSSVNDGERPGSLATLTYTPFGAVSTLLNDCAGTPCTNVQETYVYNKRLQPAVIELGSSTNHSKLSCRVYNYYVGAANASTCSESSGWPTGTNNNGNVAGLYYNDTANSGLAHQATYTYDGVNRLATAVATGSSSYPLQTYSYDAYGNMSCTTSPAAPQCLATTYYPNTNQIHYFTSGGENRGQRAPG